MFNDLGMNAQSWVLLWFYLGITSALLVLGLVSTKGDKVARGRFLEFFFHTSFFGMLVYNIVFLVKFPYLLYKHSRRLYKAYGEWNLERERRRYREAHGVQQDEHLLQGEGMLVLRGYFFFEGFLQRHSTRRRKEEYIEQLRSHRLFILDWSTRRAAYEAGIGYSTYKRIEGKHTRKAQIDTVAQICAAFEADAERLGFVACYHYTAEELVAITQRANTLMTQRKQREREYVERSTIPFGESKGVRPTS